MNGVVHGKREPQLRRGCWLEAAGLAVLLLIMSHRPAVGALTNKAPAAPPPMPSTPSPISMFRELLAMTPSERRAAITNRPPENQRQVMAKLREYESMKPDDRELRLQATELRYYLVPLLTDTTTNRAARLEFVPSAFRDMVRERLEAWDPLPVELRRELLENEAALRHFTELSSGTEEQKKRLVESLPPARRAKLEEGVQQWQAMPAKQREQLLRRFTKFFELSPSEQSRALGSISEAERRQMDRTLQQFSKLPAPQRAQCMRSFDKFASMNVEDRQQFLKNAERWQLMSPAERQSWRTLVTQLSMMPSLPTRRPPLPVPPAPRKPSTLATNTTPPSRQVPSP
jgi:hypothetical protein